MMVCRAVTEHIDTDSCYRSPYLSLDQQENISIRIRRREAVSEVVVSCLPLAFRKLEAEGSIGRVTCVT